MNIKHRWRAFRRTYLTTAVIGLGIMGSVFLLQGWYYHAVRSHIAVTNEHAANRERMWREATGMKPIPEHGDSVDTLAALLKPPMVASMTKTAGLHNVNLPEEIAAAKVPANSVPDVTDELEWCIFGNTENGYCAPGGSFSNGFRTQIEDVLSGNLNAHLHQIRKTTFHLWPRWSLKELALIWFGISGLAYGVAVANDRETDWTQPSPHLTGPYNDDVPTSYPNLRNADKYTTVVLFTSPVAAAFTIGQNEPMRVWKLWSNHAQSKRAAAKDNALLADHPKAESLLEAREVLAELEALDPKFKQDPDIAKAIKLAQGTVQKIEEIPEMIELDKAKIQATMLVRKLLPVKEDVETFATEHQQLMAEYHYPDMQRALRGLPSVTEEVPAELLTDAELQRFLNKPNSQ